MRLMSSSLCGMCVVFLGVLSRATAQAPGDGEEFCANLSKVDPPLYPANAIILMDSYNYINLLTPVMPLASIWQHVDNDNTTADDDSPIIWFQSTSIACRQTMSVCGFSFGKQNNWLISQYISRRVNGTSLPQVSVQVEFEFKGCDSNGCQRTFILNAWETSARDVATARMIANYQLFSRVAPNDDTGQSSQKLTRELDFKTEEDGFYLGILDETSCIALTRVIVFYNVCPGGVVDRVVRPQTVAPRIDRQSPLFVVTTGCVPGASPENGVIAKLTCAQGGVWTTVVGSGCQCDSGLVESGDGQSCKEGCPALQYLSKANKDECLVCPENSLSEVSGLSVCPCLTGYYRTVEETDLPCTQPPGPPTNVRVVSITATAVFLTWDPPEFTGGRSDTHYILWYEPKGGTRIPFSTVYGTMGNITGLDSNIDYRFSVSAENGVSSMDMESFESRLVVALDQFPNSIYPIIGVVSGLVLVMILVLLIVIVIVVLFQRRARFSERQLKAYHEVVPIALKGRKTYVDPLTYASPDEAVEEFAKEIEPKLLKLTSEIGAGEFGTVFQGIWKEQPKKQIHVAVKTLKPGSSGKMRSDFLNEASIMGQFQHANVIQLYGVITKVDPAMIIMELMENGSLYSYLRKNDEKLNTVRLLKMARGVCSGMEYLSAVGFVHRDLAARNILLSKDEVCKVADFGLSREVIDDEYNVQKGGKIPVRWTAPEAIFRRKFTSSSDVWSFGVLLWEVMTYAQHPYDDWDNQTVLDKLEQGYRLPQPFGCSDAVYLVMLDCWNNELSQRPSFADFLKRLDILLQNESSGKRPTKANHNNYATNPLQCKSVEEWLTSIKMERYISMFQEHGISNVRELVHITEADLREIGITLPGHLHLLTKSIESGYMELRQNVARGHK